MSINYILAKCLFISLTKESSKENFPHFPLNYGHFQPQSNLKGHEKWKNKVMIVFYY
ncbi:MAG: hypothetical protein MRERV_3c027 [Mycoplasmataceae bacterium RV_VA103A]|nr:MAG: hypothetical protein MRERV_3c027 [Mycoplasmataceae bacterium RV_VA103A]